MKKEVILVTGSSGLIGSSLINRLAHDYAMVGLDRKGPPYPPPSAECVDIDLTDATSVENALNFVKEKYGSKIASVVHLAAFYDFSGKENSLYDEVTVKGTARLLEALSKLEFSVEQFIFSSTMLLHRPCKIGEKITEDSPLEGKWAYPQSKIDTEEVIREQAGSIPYVLARIAGVYDDYCNSIPLSRQIQRIYENDLTARLFPGNTEAGQSFIHLDDLTQALRTMILKRNNLPQAFPILLGEPETLGYGDLQKAFSRLIHGEEMSLKRVPKVFAKAGAALQNSIPGLEDPFIKPWMIDLADDHYALNISRAKTMLGWTPQRSLKDSLGSMVKALKNNPERWYERHGLGPSPEQKKEHEKVQV